MTAPNTRLIATQPLRERLIGQRNVTPAGCWEWGRAKTDDGYGRMSYRNRVHKVHRLSAHEWLGLDLADPATKVCHHCDNPPCFNPEHLYLGSQSRNVQDMIARGRGYGGPSRWTVCGKGHDMTPENTVGTRQPRCRQCNNEGQRRRAKLKAIQALDGSAS